MFFKKFHMRDSVKIMSMGITIYQKYIRLAERLSAKYNKLWVAAEVLLFVLV